MDSNPTTQTQPHHHDDDDDGTLNERSGVEEVDDYNKHG